MKYEPNDPSLVLTLYRCFWLAVVAIVIAVACSWADTGMHGECPVSRTPSWDMFKEGKP
jgi:hypothetical protein